MKGIEYNTNGRGRNSIVRACMRLFLMVVIGISGNTYAQSIAGQPDKFEVAINKSRVMQLHQPIQKVSMGNPEIADIVVLRKNQIYILGKRLGTTNVLLWDKNAELIKALDIEVTHDLNQLKKKLFELIPDEKIEVYSSQGSIVLKGQIDNLSDMESAVRIARSFAVSALKEEKIDDRSEEDFKTLRVEPVVNLLTIGGSSQVLLKVTVAELERNTVKKLGVKWYAADRTSSKWGFGGVGGGGSFQDFVNADGLRTLNYANPPIVGPVIDEFLPNDLSISDKGIFASFLSNDFVFAMALEAAKDNGTAKVLAEPTLTALSGSQAKFLSGGEFPIPVHDDDGTTIEFKEFGVKVVFTPTVLSSGSINLQLAVSVSELSFKNVVEISSSDNSSRVLVPSLVTRSTSTTVELADGQTIGIAGLISENMRAVITKFPGLGDIPIIGHLFRSEEFERGETELVIMVTPQLAQPMNRPLASLPTDSFIEPSDMEFYLLGQTHGRLPRQSGSANYSETAIEQRTSDSSIATKKGGVDGQFGHSID